MGKEYYSPNNLIRSSIAASKFFQSNDNGSNTMRMTSAILTACLALTACAGAPPPAALDGTT
jgi:hypothetical protein